MVRFLLLSIFLTSGTIRLFSQESLLLSLAIGPKGDIYKMDDPGRQLATGYTLSRNAALPISMGVSDSRMTPT